MPLYARCIRNIGVLDGLLTNTSTYDEYHRSAISYGAIGSAIFSSLFHNLNIVRHHRTGYGYFFGVGSAYCCAILPYENKHCCVFLFSFASFDQSILFLFACSVILHSLPNASARTHTHIIQSKRAYCAK